MATCSTANCTCKNFYTDWAIGQRTGGCEDCGHLKTEHSREQQIQPGRKLMDSTPAVFALGVKNIDARVGVELSGNAIAVKENKILTTFHNIYDELPHNYDRSFDSSLEFLFQDAHSIESNEPVILRIFKHAIISQCVTKRGLNNQEEYTAPILLSFVEGNYDEDWAVLETVSGVKTHCGIDVIDNPSDFRYLQICPESKLPCIGIEKLKGYHFDIALYKSSTDPEETLNCQRVEYSLVTMYKKISKVIRMQGALSFGSCGSPSINESGEVVAIHLASLDSTASRQPKTRFRAMKISGVKRARLSHSSLKMLASQAEQQLDVMYEEQDRVLEEITSIAESYTEYKEAFVLCKSPRLMQLLV